MKRFLALAPLLLAACSQPQAEPPKPVEWAVLPDGSKASVGEIDILPAEYFDGPSSVMRCWPKGAAFDCLIGTRNSYSFMDFRRVTTTDLPQHHEDSLLKPAVGYRCLATNDGGWQESVHSSAGEIKANVVSFMELPRPNSWPKADVEKLFRDNAIQPAAHWMNCKNLTGIVSKTSLASVASTEVTLALIDGT